MGGNFGSSNQQSTSNSYGYNDSLAQSVNASNQSVWGPQAGGLQQLYGQAQKLMGQQGNMQGISQGQVNQVMPGARAGMAATQDIAGGGGPLAQYAQPNNALAQQETESLAQTVGDQFRRQVLPGLTSNANLTGGLGGSRDALARGVAGGDAARAISQGATDLYGQQYAIGAQAAQGQTSAQLAAGSALPEMASSIYNLGMTPQQAAWAPLTSAAGVFGGPTVLGQSYGLSQAQSLAQNWGNSQSSGKSTEAGFKFF